MRLAREALGLSQPAFNEQYGDGGSVRSYQKNEKGLNEAGICLAAAFIRAGINANWLLTGEGPMLLADLVQPAAPAQAARINVDALEAIIEGSFIAAPKMPPDQRADLCASLYQGLIDRGEITPQGIGPGNASNAA